MPERLMPEAAMFVSHCCQACWDRDRAQFASDAFVPLRMIVCPDCGDKRCSRATNHLYACGRPPVVPITTTVDLKPASFERMVGEALGEALGPD